MSKEWDFILQRVVKREEIIVILYSGDNCALACEILADCTADQASGEPISLKNQQDKLLISEVKMVSDTYEGYTNYVVGAKGTVV